MMELYGCRFPFDHPLLTSLADRWQRTNTFHLHVGEMTITLEDVEKLLCLPLDGDAVADNEVNNSNNWKTRLLECFSTAERKEDAPPFVSFKDEKCIPLSWLVDRFSILLALFTFRYINICSSSSYYNCSAQVEFMPDNATEETLKFTWRPTFCDFLEE